MPPPTITASNDGASLSEDRDLISGSVLRNDRGQGPLSVISVDGLTQNLGGPVLGAYGVLRVTSDGRFTYDLDNRLAAIQGLRAGQTLAESFSYTVTDVSGATATATLAITIVGRNDRPALLADRAVASAGTGPVTGTLLANDTDPDGDLLSVTSIRRGREAVAPGDAVAGRFGSLTVEADGSYRYDLNETAPGYVRLAAGATRTDNFRVTVSDGNGGFATQIMSITVVGRNDAPVANDDTREMTEDRDWVAGRVLRNDRDVDRDPLRVAEVNGDSQGVGAAIRGLYGSLTLQADGQYTYDLDNGMAVVQGLDTGETLTELFTYAVSDPSGATDTATLTITITGRNDRPIAVADSFMVAPGRSTVLDVLANDRDPDGEALSVSILGRPRNGTVSIDGDGNVVYTPRAGFIGTDRFTYITSDGTITSNRATVTVNVAPLPAPTIGLQSADAGDVAEGNPGAAVPASLTFTLTRSGDTGQASVVRFTVAGDVAADDIVIGNAIRVGDGPAGTLGLYEAQFNAGVSALPILVTAVGDTSFEPNETVRLELTQVVQNGTLGGITVSQGRILNDYVPPAADLSLTLEWADGGNPVAPGGVAIFRLTVRTTGRMRATARRASFFPLARRFSRWPPKAARRLRP